MRRLALMSNKLRGRIVRAHLRRAAYQLDPLTRLQQKKGPASSVAPTPRSPKATHDDLNLAETPE